MAWRHVVQAFRGDHRVVLLDLAGVGPGNQSHFDHVRYGSLDAYARDVTAVLEALRIENCVCVGHSVAGILQTRQDPAVTFEAAEFLRDHLTDSVLEILDASGHLPHLSAPDTVIAALARHLS